MKNRLKDIPLKGLVVLLVILIVVSIVAFVLSSIEGFIAGVVVVFIGLLFSVFRDDLKRVLGLSKKTEEPQPIVIDKDKPMQKLEKTIAKGREKIEKIVSKFEGEQKSYKQQKIAREIVERTTALIATIDLAKSCAIQMRDKDLLQHYNIIADEIKEIRGRYQSYTVS
ncbi:MAG: hypothetical protein ACTSWA_08550 [Candidatus Thorarchaeota archaeon]